MSGISEDDLDTLLGAPLADVQDAGFSTRVSAGLAARAQLRERLTMYGLAAACAALVPFLPGVELAGVASRVTPLIADSAAVSVAAAALILTISFEQRLREWQSAL